MRDGSVSSHRTSDPALDRVVNVLAHGDASAVPPVLPVRRSEAAMPRVASPLVAFGEEAALVEHVEGSVVGLEPRLEVAPRER